MKKVFTLLLFIITAFASEAAVYYCSPSGNDNNAGTFASPWFSLNRAWQTIVPGDTVYLRGGTYAYTAQIQGYCTNKNGTAANRIVVSNYQSEIPIITRTAAYQNNVQHWRGGVYFSGDYFHWRGISFTGFKHINAESSPFIWRGFYTEDVNFNIFELLKSYGNELGISVQGNSRGNLIKNCDAWYNYDANTGGGNADGMGTNYITVNDPANPNVFRGCRVWWNGDDGFDGWTGTEVGGITVFDSCWSWNNGYFPGTFNQAGNGEGFKGGGGGSANPNTFQRIYQNCIAFYNKHDGFNQNNLNAKVKVYNCIAYKNAITGINFSENNNAHEWRNNVVFDNLGCQAYITAESVVSNNSYGLGSSPNGICGPGQGLPWTNNVTAADFVSVDTTGVGGPRQADGSLPNLNFMKLNASSDLIDAGINVGLPYTGVAPDRGAFETGGAAPPPNQAPTASAGTDKNITLPTNTITQVGGGSDPDGVISSFLWTKIAGPATFTIVSPASSTTVINNLVQGVYQFQLTVTDNAGASDTDTMVVTVNAAANQAPTANAGADRNITLPTNSITQTGSGTDPDGTISAYQWTKVSGPTTFTIVSPTQAQTVINNLVQGVYQFELRVTDNQGAFDTDTFNLTVNAAPPPNQAPTANAGPDRNITLPSNSFTQTGSGSDPDGSISAYQWTKVSGPTTFTIVSPTQAQTVINNLVQGVYQFELRVTDNQGAFDTDTFSVTVNPAPNQAPSANAGPDQNLVLPTNSFTQTGSGNDPDGSIVSYQWSKVSGPAQYVIISPLLPQTVINNLVQGVYQFELLVTDNQGATGRDTMTVTLGVAPPNQAPTANAGPDRNITLPANSFTQVGSGSDPDGTITSYQWTKIAGPAQFTIVSPTQAQTVINNLVQGVYQFELLVTDNQGATDRDTMAVTVNAAPNQPPTANAGTDKNITLPVNSITQTGSGSDPDGTIASYLWTKVAGPAQFTIVSPTQAQTVINNLVQGVYQFELLVTDNQGATDRDTMVVTVNGVPANQPPVANAGTDKNITLPVNSITQTGSGTDPDGSIVSYQWARISGPATYTIVSPTQAQTVINNLVQGVYQFELTVTDNQGSTDTDTMTVTVNPSVVPNQPPTANAGPDTTITLPVNVVIINGSGTDPDGSIVSYAWSKISGPAQYTIVFPTQAQTAFSDLVQGTYEFELTVTDNQGATARDTVTVTVSPNQSRVSTATIYPNPATTNINVRIEAVTYANKTQIQIINVMGVVLYNTEVMRTQQLMTIPIDISKLPAGSYFLKLSLDINNVRTLPFIKQ